MTRIPILLAALTLLSACEGPPEEAREDFRHGTVVRSCRSGVLVVRGGRSHRLIAYRPESGFTSDMMGYVGEGLTPEQVCE